MHPFSTSPLARPATVIAHPARGEARLPRRGPPSRGSLRNPLPEISQDQNTSMASASSVWVLPFCGGGKSWKCIACWQCWLLRWRQTGAGPTRRQVCRKGRKGRKPSRWASQNQSVRNPVMPGTDSATIRIRPAAKRESGALIRAGVAGGAAARQPLRRAVRARRGASCRCRSSRGGVDPVEVAVVAGVFGRAERALPGHAPWTPRRDGIASKGIP